MTATMENVWRTEIKPHAETNRKAKKLREKGFFLSAYVTKITAYYSYATEPSGLLGRVFTFWNFARARHYVHLALEEAKIESLESLTYEECNIIGALLLRKHLWWQPDPIGALSFLQMGLQHISAPPSSVALMHMGCAKAYHLLAQDAKSEECMLRALALEAELTKEPNEVHARRQFLRVLWKAVELSNGLPHKASDIDAPDVTRVIFSKAYSYSQQWGSESQRFRLYDMAQRMDRLSWWEEEECMAGKEMD